MTCHPSGEQTAHDYGDEFLLDQEFEVVTREDCPPRNIYLTTVPIAGPVTWPVNGTLPYGYEKWQRN